MAAKDEGRGKQRRTPQPSVGAEPERSGARRTRRRTPSLQENAPETLGAGASGSPPAEPQTAPTQSASAAGRARRTSPRTRRPAAESATPEAAAAEEAAAEEAAARVSQQQVDQTPPVVEMPLPESAATADAEAAAVLEDEMAPAEALEEAGAAGVAPAASVERREVPQAAPGGAEEAAEHGAATVELGATADESDATDLDAAGEEPERPRRERQRAAHGNALGALIERHFADTASPCRSYSDLERHSGISREALSRYVTARPDRRRSPTIDTLVAIADAMHLSLESVARAAAASVKGVMPPSDAEQEARQEVLGTLVAALTPEQFGAVVELLRQFRPVQHSA